MNGLFDDGARNPGQPAQMPRPGYAQERRPGFAQDRMTGQPAQMPQPGQPGQMPHEGEELRPQQVSFIGNPLIDKYIQGFIG